jgi:hypothetical protein
LRSFADKTNCSLRLADSLANGLAGESLLERSARRLAR